MDVQLTDEQATLLNQRMKHIGEAGFSTLVSGNIAERNPGCSMGLRFCEQYLQGKKIELTFSPQTCCSMELRFILCE